MTPPAHMTTRAARVVRRAAAASATAAALFAGAGVVGAVSAHGEGSTKQDVSNMDLDLLRENLLKIWIIEFTSQQYNQSKIAQRSFEGLVGASESTGDPEKDRLRAEARKKTDKELRHYMLLELDGAIEAVDICDRVLGTKNAVDGSVAEARQFLSRELPAIAWKNILLQDAVAELGRTLGVTTALHPTLPKNLTLEISFDAPAGMSVLGVLEYINSIHPVGWKYEAGKLDITYLGEIPKNPYGR